MTDAHLNRFAPFVVPALAGIDRALSCTLSREMHFAALHTKTNNFAIRFIALTMHHNHSKLALVVATLAFAFSPTGYAQDKPAAASAEKITFDEHVKPIFRAHCLNCHNQGDSKGGLALDSYTATVEGGGSGEIVYDDGDPDASRLWQLVNHDDTPVMPPKQDKLPAAELAVIKAWIEGGILENSGSKAKAKKKNALAFVASTGAKPDGDAAMPQDIPQQVPVVSGRAAAVTAIAASPWAPLVAIAGQKQIVLYHSDTGELLGVLPMDEGIAQSLRFSRDGSFLIAGGGEHSVKGIVAVYDVKTGKRVATVGDELDTVFSADVNDKMSRIALGGPQKMLRIYDAGNGEKLFDIKKHTDWIFAVAFSPDGRFVASGDRSGGLYIWEANTGRLHLDLAGHKGAIHQLDFRDDSKVLASASEDGTVKLWDVDEGKQIKSFNAHGGGVTAVAFDHQARLVTAGKDNKASLWDASTKKLKDFVGMSEDVLEVAVSHDGKRIIYGDWTGQVLVAQTDDPKKVQKLAANPAPVSERIKSAKTAMVSIQAQLAPMKTAWDAAQVDVTATKKPVDDLQAQINALQAEAAKANQAVAASQEKLKVIDAALPNLTNLSRDLHDAVIAARVKLKSAPNETEAVAAAELKLAEQLTQLAQKRRARIAATTSIAANQKLAAVKKAESDQLAATMPPLKAKLDAASKLATQAKAKHDAVVANANAAKHKVDQLSAALK